MTRTLVETPCPPQYDGAPPSKCWAFEPSYTATVEAINPPASPAFFDILSMGLVVVLVMAGIMAAAVGAAAAIDDFWRRG